MSIFQKNISFGLIKEVGEDDVLIELNNQDVVFQMEKDVKELVFQNVAEGIYVVPVDLKEKRIVLGLISDSVQEFNISYNCKNCNVEHFTLIGTGEHLKKLCHKCLVSVGALFEEEQQ